MKPQFTPRGGIGTTYKDPKTGTVWQFTQAGWQEKSTQIVQEVAEKTTFEVKPDEQELVDKLKAGGSTQEQINQGLVERRRVMGNLGSVDQVGDREISRESVESRSPFGNMTKREVLIDAFNKGVTNVSELNKISDLYDLFSGEELAIDMEDFEMLSPQAKERAREKVKKAIIQKGQELGTGAEREGVLGAIGTFDTGQELIDMLESGVATGILSGISRGGVSIFGRSLIPGKRALGKTTAEEDRLNSLMTVYTAQFIKAISGAQVSDKEREFLMNALPSESKTKQNNIEGIKAIEEFLSNRYSASLGVSMDPLKSSEGLNDPVGIFSDDESINPLGI